MRKITLLKTVLVSMALLLGNINSFGQTVKVTEVMSNSGLTSDWFELTNYGTSDVDITGWTMDDNSYAFTSAVALSGITTIPAGESVVFFEIGEPTVDVATFKTFWGSSLDNVSVGTYSGSKVGLSATADGVIIFKADGTEVNRVSFGAATEGSSFYWSYSTDGSVIDNGILSTVGTIDGTTSNQVTLISTDATADIASPGTAIVYPVSTSLNSVSIKNWTLIGKTLSFDILPTTQIEVFGLTGSKLAVYEPAKSIELNLQKGIYILRVNNSAFKIIIK